MNTVLFVNVTLLNELHLTSKQGITKYANTLPNFTKKKDMVVLQWKSVSDDKSFRALQKEIPK